jgi:hypothetical protein
MLKFRPGNIIKIVQHVHSLAIGLQMNHTLKISCCKPGAVS